MCHLFTSRVEVGARILRIHQPSHTRSINEQLDAKLVVKDRCRIVYKKYAEEASAGGPARLICISSMNNCHIMSLFNLLSLANSKQDIDRNN